MQLLLQLWMALIETMQMFLSLSKDFHVLLVYFLNYVLSLLLGFEFSPFSSSDSIDSGYLVDATSPTVVDSSF